MDIEKLIERMRKMAVGTGGLNCLGCGFEHGCDVHGCAVLKDAATALSTLQAENEKLRAELDAVRAERDAAANAVKNMAKYIVCAGRVDYFLCDQISQEHHLKYQPRNDGNYDNGPCYECVADWFMQGNEWGGA